MGVGPEGRGVALLGGEVGRGIRHRPTRSNGSRVHRDDELSGLRVLWYGRRLITIDLAGRGRDPSGTEREDNEIEGAIMATFEKPKPSEHVPIDLLPVIFESGVLTERQFSDLRTKVLRGDYPSDSTSLAARLVGDRILTDYQVRRFLNNKSYGLVVGRYVILDRLGAGSMGRVYKAH